MNNPTAGATDGTALSQNGDLTSPLVVTLDASINESKKVKLAIRTQPGYSTAENTVIKDNNDTNDRWKFSLTEDGVFSDSITISSAISTVNSIFYAQATSSSLESPIRDTSVSLDVDTVIIAVS